MPYSSERRHGLKGFKRTLNIGGEEVTLPSIVNRSTILIALLILAAFILALTSLYSVGPEEEGVVQRFGRYVRTTNSGLHVKLPFGIETVRKVKVKFVFKEEFGFRTIKPGVRTVYSDKNYLNESLMLSGDLNLAVVEWIVQYKIKDAKNYLFNASFLY